MVFRMKLSDTCSAVMRLPKTWILRLSREEKVKIEVAVMRLFGKNTNLPVPLAFHCGIIEESPGQLGPFIQWDR